MLAGEFCNRDVVVIGEDESVGEAARLMRAHHVGDVVVVRDRDGKRVPTGIVTDRDLVVEVLAPELTSADLAVKDLVTAPLVVAHDRDGLMEVLGLMRRKGVRRIPVVRADGELAGILSVDDLLELLTEMLSDLSILVRREHDHEMQTRP